MTDKASSLVDAYDYLLKCIVIGDSSVGKSSLMLRYMDDTFRESNITTIGIDLRFKTIDVSGKRVKLQIWDTAGQERFRSIRSSYYRGAHVIVLVYAVDSKVSFESVQQWVRECNEHADPNVTRVLVGNKCDVPDSCRQVTFEQGATFAQYLGVEFRETSARSNTNVNELFTGVAHCVCDHFNTIKSKDPKCVQNMTRTEVDTSSGVSLMPDDPTDLQPMVGPVQQLVNTSAQSAAAASAGLITLGSKDALASSAALRKQKCCS